MDRNFGTGEQRFGPDGERAARLGGIDFHDDGTGRGRAELESFTLTQRVNSLEGHVAYFFVSQPSR